MDNEIFNEGKDKTETRSKKKERKKKKKKKKKKGKYSQNNVSYVVPADYLTVKVECKIHPPQKKFNRNKSFQVRKNSLLVELLKKVDEYYKKEISKFLLVTMVTTNVGGCTTTFISKMEDELKDYKIVNTKNAEVTGFYRRIRYKSKTNELEKTILNDSEIIVTKMTTKVDALDTVKEYSSNGKNNDRKKKAKELCSLYEKLKEEDKDLHSYIKKENLELEDFMKLVNEEIEKEKMLIENEKKLYDKIRKTCLKDGKFITGYKHFFMQLLKIQEKNMKDSEIFEKFLVNQKGEEIFSRGEGDHQLCFRKIKNLCGSAVFLMVIFFKNGDKVFSTGFHLSYGIVGTSGHAFYNGKKKVDQTSIARILCVFNYEEDMRKVAGMFFAFVDIKKEIFVEFDTSNKGCDIALMLLKFGDNVEKDYIKGHESFDVGCFKNYSVSCKKMEDGTLLLSGGDNKYCVAVTVLKNELFIKEKQPLILIHHPIFGGRINSMNDFERNVKNMGKKYSLFDIFVKSNLKSKIKYGKGITRKGSSGGLVFTVYMGDFHPSFVHKEGPNLEFKFGEDEESALVFDDIECGAVKFSSIIQKLYERGIFFKLDKGVPGYVILEMNFEDLEENVEKSNKDFGVWDLNKLGNISPKKDTDVEMEENSTN